MNSLYKTEHAEWRGGGALASETRCVFIVNILFVILCNIFNLSKFFVYPTDTKDKRENQRTQVTQFTRWKAAGETGFDWSVRAKLIVPV